MNKTLADILKPLDGYLREVDVSIRRLIHSGIPVIDDSALYLFQRGGKKIRASLVLMTSGLNGSIPDGVVDLAAATEIVHAASLIHDDIIDQSILRRGNISVPQKWGNKVSVLIGDYMYSLALNCAVNDGNPELFPMMVNGSKDMVKGELYQLQYSNLDSITEEHYFNIIELKTARFMAFSAEIGGVKAGFSKDRCRDINSFGLNLGFAFQIIDDTLDILDNTQKTGKDIGNDLRDGKITLPFLYIMNKKGPEMKYLLSRYSEHPESETWEMIKKYLHDEGALDYAINHARAYIDKAIAVIQTFPAGQYRDMLIELAEFFVYRDF